MERCQKRRRSLVDGLFQPAVEVGGAQVRVLKTQFEGFGETQPLVMVSNDEDDLLFVPGVMTALPETMAFDTLNSDDRFVLDRGETRPKTVAVFRASPADPIEGTRAVLDMLRRCAEWGDLAPVHGFIAHQKMMGGDDPELSAAVIQPTSDGVGRGRRIELLDTGLAKDFAWAGAEVRTANGRDVDPLAGLIDAKNLGRAAGHGSFIAGLCHQIVPGCEVVVHRVANTEGFVDELTLADRIDAIARPVAQPIVEPVVRPDVILLCFGGYSVKLGSFNTSTKGDGDDWTHPALLRASLLALHDRCPDSVVVVSAGNNQSTDPCYPAAFAGQPEFESWLVSVAALDNSGHRWPFSNYGPWVSASTLGVRLRGAYVVGNESPGNDPDGHPEHFRAPSFATWTGTSFAAPLVAARIIALQDSLGAKYGSMTAVEAWARLRDTSTLPRHFGCGVHVVVGNVAHD